MKFPAGLSATIFYLCSLLMGYIPLVAIPVLHFLILAVNYFLVAISSLGMDTFRNSFTKGLEMITRAQKNQDMTGNIWSNCP